MFSIEAAADAFRYPYPSPACWRGQGKGSRFAEYRVSNREHEPHQACDLHFQSSCARVFAAQTTISCCLCFYFAMA